MKSSRLPLGVFVATLILVFPACAGAQTDDPPTLIISIGGIQSYKPGRSGEAVLAQTQKLFGTDAKHYDSSTINMYDVTRRNRPSMGPEAVQEEARRLAADVTKTPHRVVRFQTEIPGIDDLVRGEVERRALAGKVALDLTVEVLRQSHVGEQIKTRWEEQTKRGAVAVELMVREFKEKYGKDAKVVLVGHSAGTDLVNCIPTTYKDKDGTDRRLVDWRVMSSPMVRSLQYQDPTRTVFVTHVRDFPAAHFAYPGGPQTAGDLSKQGFVLEMHGGSALAPADAHSKTYQYDADVEMRVKTFSGDVNIRGKPGTVIKDIMKLNDKAGGKGDRVPQQLIQKLKEQKPKESIVGGISLTKAAEVPVDPADIEALQFDYPHTAGAAVPYKGLSFRMKSGETMYLPQCGASIDATILLCVYSDILPEISIAPISGENGAAWKRVDYPNDNRGILPYTNLGDMLLAADSVVGDIAFGNTTSYRPPPTIDNYHPYFELALDNKLFMGETRGIRAWLVPSVIRTEVYVDRLQYQELRMAYRFEAFDNAGAAEYFAGKGQGYLDPAGEFLSAQLTANYDALEVFFRELGNIREAAGLAGILIWARRHGVSVDAASWQVARRVHSEDQGQSRENHLSPAQGQNFYVYKKPAGAQRKPTAETIRRPATLFNEFGPSRILWTDGSTSTIEYDASGRIVSMIGRRDNGTDVTKVLYDVEGRPLAMADRKGNAVAVIWAGEMPILCRQVKVAAGTREAVLDKRSRFELTDDAGSAFTDLLAAWLGAQERNERTDEWLSGPKGPVRMWPYMWLGLAMMGAAAGTLWKRQSPVNWDHRVTLDFGDNVGFRWWVRLVLLGSGYVGGLCGLPDAPIIGAAAALLVSGLFIRFTSGISDIGAGVAALLVGSIAAGLAAWVTRPWFADGHGAWSSPSQMGLLLGAYLYLLCAPFLWSMGSSDGKRGGGAFLLSILVGAFFASAIFKAALWVAVVISVIFAFLVMGLGFAVERIVRRWLSHPRTT